MMTLRKMACCIATSTAVWGTSSQICQATDTPKDANKKSEQRIHEYLEEFVSEPHPFGSRAQKEYANRLKKRFEKAGFEVFVQGFDTQAPNLATIGRSLPRMQNISGQNILAVKKKSTECGILWGGHYDTKYFPNFTFVGANDGGSSTALLLELASSIKERNARRDHKQNSPAWGECSQIFALFDGEESVLPQWTDGEKIFGQKDHLYGSRHFAKTLEPQKKHWEFNGIPITLVIIADMVGHKQQDLSITFGSVPSVSKQIASVKKQTKIEEAQFSLEDDHTAFAEKGIPFVHIIDWKNIDEWHTPQDTLKIVSEKKIGELTQVFLRFLDLPKT
jgi:hypothetical protein